MNKKMSFNEFIYSKFKSFSHGHDWHHEEIDGLYYRREDYDKALEQYDDYEFKFYLREGKNGLSKRIHTNGVKR